jgi:cytochrome d ubiquinol oxidase subunit I
MQAAEGFWAERSRSPAPYLWIVVPDPQHQRNRFEIGTPVLGSIWLTHSLSGRVEGLRNTPRARQPVMAMVFYSFRLMFVTAIAMFAVVAISLWLRLRRRLFDTRWFLKVLVFMAPSGVLATLGGWYTAEIGRQPFVIYGLLRTADAVSPVPASMLLTTLIAFVCIYALFLTAFLTFTLRLIRKGPAAIASHLPVHADVAAARSHAWRALGTARMPRPEAAE